MLFGLALHMVPNKNNYRASTWWKKDMSFLRLKSFLEIGYTFPKKWMEKFYSKGARICQR